MSNSHLAVAVHAMSVLANLGGRVSSTLLAGSVGTNPVFLRRVLAMLGEAGLVETHRGINGGISLTRPAKDISMFDVYKAVMPEDALFKIHGGVDPKCPVGGGIQKSLESVFDDATAAVWARLKQTSIQDMRDAAVAQKDRAAAT